jgi:uncharacterized protein YbaP (TraB family)
MFLRSAAAVVFALFGLPAAAQCVGDSYLDQLTDTQRTQLSDAVENMPYAEGLVWTATKDTATVTVVGTMHIYDPRLEGIRARSADAIANADLVLLEATPKEQAQLENLVTTDPSVLFLVDGPTLPELLDEETWALLADAATQRSIPSFMAAKMQPWYLSLMLAIPSCAMADITAGVLGLDHMITQDALAANIPVQALEPYTTLFDIFKEATLEEQIDMLRLSLFAPERQQQMFVAMLDRYFAEDVGRLWEMSRLALGDIPDLDPAEGAEMFAEMQDALLDQRNRNWMPVITDASAANDKIVVAVGAAHLIGEQGVLKLLEDDGWTLTRVP